MANYTYKETTTKNLKAKGTYSKLNGTIKYFDKDGNEIILSVAELLEDFDGSEMTLTVTDKEEHDLLDE